MLNRTSKVHLVSEEYYNQACCYIDIAFMKFGRILFIFASQVIFKNHLKYVDGVVICLQKH